MSAQLMFYRFLLLESVYQGMWDEVTGLRIRAEDARSTMCHARPAALLESYDAEVGKVNASFAAARDIFNIALREQMYCAAMTESIQFSDDVLLWSMDEVNDFFEGRADEKPIMDRILETLDDAIHDTMESPTVQEMVDNFNETLMRSVELSESIIKVCADYARDNGVDYSDGKLMDKHKLLLEHLSGGSC